MGEFGKIVWKVETSSSSDKLQLQLNELANSGWCIFTILDSSDEDNLFYTIVANRLVST